jgi:hypothetical protein
LGNRLKQLEAQKSKVFCLKRFLSSKVFGGNSEEETPVPIPNTAVKLFSADGTAWVTAWESRTPPNQISKAPRVMRGFFYEVRKEVTGGHAYSGVFTLHRSVESFVPKNNNRFHIWQSAAGIKRSDPCLSMNLKAGFSSKSWSEKRTSRVLEGSFRSQKSIVKTRGIEAGLTGF